MKTRQFRYFAADFETTVYEGQEYTEVWAAACVELYTEKCHVYHSIEDLFSYFKNLKCNLVVYFHNLKFDGNFWLPFLYQEGFTESWEIVEEGEHPKVKWKRERDMKNKEFKYSISEMGQWYNIILKINGYIVEIRDSLKLLPFSLKRIGESFGTKHKKLEMEYEGFRYAGCNISEEERKYIENDVLVLKEAIEIMFNDNHKELTIGSCCLKEYKRIIGKDDYEMFFPNLYEIPIDGEEFGSPTAGDYLVKSYRGGWCYLVKGKEKKVYKKGCTFDANSLYPSVMHSDSGNYYPVGEPAFFKGPEIPEEAKKEKRFYFVRIRTRFYLKPGKLPFVQIKNNLLYRGTEMLETSDVYDEKSGEYCRFLRKKDGAYVDTRVTLTLTMMDYELLRVHYNLEDFEILDGCWFYAEIGLFDAYINYYGEIKMVSKGAKREEAKLFLNNLYGKFATNPDSSFKVAFLKPGGSIGFYLVEEREKKPGYIAIGAAITSYARNNTIDKAQKNYYGPEKPGFIYSDTDSWHGDLEPDEVKGIPIDPVKFCYWKCESQWDTGYFVRQKTYIEHVTHENMNPIEPHYDVRCAGMPENCKELFLCSMTGDTPKDKKLSEEEKEFLKVRRKLEDFNVGLLVPGKLRPKRIRGGVILEKSTYEMKGDGRI